jgi:hypothetical protein
VRPDARTPGSRRCGLRIRGIAGHAFVQNVRRGHYELAVEAPANQRVVVAFGELALAI